MNSGSETFHTIINIQNASLSSRGGGGSGCRITVLQGPKEDGGGSIQWASTHSIYIILETGTEEAEARKTQM